MSAGTDLSFGEYRLDVESGQLYRDTVPVPLTPKAFAVLHCLAARPGKLVAKEKLLDAAWRDVFVGDAVLKVTIREIRKALGDDSHAPRFIETAHRRGYRFIAPVSTTSGVISGLPPSIAPPARIAAPRVQYAHSSNVNIAYQVVGSGPIDLVFVMGWVSHLEYFWNEPSCARFLTRLASMSRLIVFDKRGTGLSDPVPVSQLPTLEQRMDDVGAVLEAAGSERAVLLGVSEGGPLCTMFAATYPQKTAGLIAIGSYARRLVDSDYPWGETREEREAFCATLIEQWGGPVGIEERAPGKADDPAFRDWWAAYLRMGASPGAAVALTRMNAEIDVRAVLPSIRVPTLVLHRTGDRCLKVDEGRYLASRIPTAVFVELPGEDHLPFVGDQDAMLDEIERFLSQTPASAAAERVLATVLTVNAETQAGDREHLGRVFAREVATHRGRLLNVKNAALVAMFDGPGRAVRCGCSVKVVAGRSAIGVRAGVHIGECEPTAIAGPVMDISAGLADAAAPGEVLVSRTVVDLVPGSGLQFAERGIVAVLGIERPVSALAVTGQAS